MTFAPMDLHLTIILVLGVIITLAVILAAMIKLSKVEQEEDKYSDERAKRIVAVAYGNRSKE